ncbi:MAG: aminoacyl-tRNA hydrolase [Lentisphaerae bacterium]|nr:aminoacyl-tRNA hydrolase [Lentisphaerota bacterium]
MNMIVGLGNPGKQYERTPHNAGFGVLDEIAARLNCGFRRSIRFRAWTGRVAHENNDWLLVKPATYMNRSGEAVRAIVKENGLKPEDIIVVFDDVNLKFGQIRIRQQGSAGGHNGVKSLIAHLQTDEFVRVRIGVGSAENDETLTEHVLGRYSGAIWDDVLASYRKAADAVFAIVSDGLDQAMNHYN